MEQINVKKKSYEILERINSFSLRVKDEKGEDRIVYDFNENIEGFLDFKFAYKRLKTCGINIPTVYELDKKNHRALLEDVKGDTVYDLLREKNLDEAIIEQAFVFNYKARINRLRLNFDPTCFISQNDKLVYMPFTFTEYIRDEDFTQKEIRLWFYTNDFKERLIKDGLPVDKNRLKNEYERNKEIVLTVVKYFK